MKILKIKKIKIFNNIYTIKYVDKISNDNDRFTFGRTNSIDREILIATKGINKNLSLNSIKLTLLHELVHVILDEGCYSEESANEHLVEWLAKGFKEIIDKNII